MNFGIILAKFTGLCLIAGFFCIMMNCMCNPLSEIGLFWEKWAKIFITIFCVIIVIAVIIGICLI